MSETTETTQSAERTALKDIPSASQDCSQTTATITMCDSVSPPNECKPQAPPRIDTTALSGLRGLLAIHIMVFHSLLFSELEINTLGSVQMSFFFLLSGFTFGISESNRTYIRNKCCSELCTRGSTARNYWQRRAARTLPLYYLTNLLSIPLLFGRMLYLSGLTTMMTVSGVLTCLVATTWLVYPLVVNGPSWFVATIWFFYWVFPSLYPRLKSYSTAQKRKWIVIHAWLQFGIAFIIYVLCMATDIPSWLGFLAATFWPPARLSVFIMGLLAGMLRSEGLSISEKREAWTASQWRICADRLAVLLIVILIAGSVCEGIVGDELLFLNFWLQIILPFWQLLFIFSLTMYGGMSDEEESGQRSYSQRLLSAKWALWCGEMSYAIYLVHEPVRSYICWIMNAPQLETPQCATCDDEWEEWNAERMLSKWGIPLVWLFSVLIAVVLNKCVERPMRRWLRPNNIRSKEIKEAGQEDK